MVVTFFRVGADQAQLDAAFPEPVKQASARARAAILDNDDALDKRGRKIDQISLESGDMVDGSDAFVASAAKMAQAGQRKPGCCSACIVQ